MNVQDYVWDRLSWRKNFVGRAVVNRLVAEALNTRIECGEDGQAAAAAQIVASANRDGSLGLIVLSYLLPYLAAEIVKLVLRWLESQQGGPMGSPSLPRIHG